MRKISTVAGEPPVPIVHVGRQMYGAAWSRENITVFATEEGLFRVPASGGKATVVAKPDSAREERLYGWPEWLPGGKAIVFSLSRRTGPAANAVIPAAGGVPKIIVPVGTNPRWSPTGHSFAAHFFPKESQITV